MIPKIIYTGISRIDEKFRIRHFIPYHISRHQRYEINRIYYNNYWSSYFKVIDVEYNKNGFLDDAYVKWEDGCYGLICTELQMDDYLLSYDSKKIYNIKEIINNGRSYTGAEIRYWFFINKITVLDEKYQGFWRYLDNNSGYCIQDNTRYRLFADLNNNTYERCRIVRLKT